MLGQDLRLAGRPAPGGCPAELRGAPRRSSTGFVDATPCRGFPLSIPSRDLITERRPTRPSQRPLTQIARLHVGMARTTLLAALVGCILTVLPTSATAPDGLGGHCKTIIINNPPPLGPQATCDYHNPCPPPQAATCNKDVVTSGGTTTIHCQCAGGEVTNCCSAVWAKVGNQILVFTGGDCYDQQDSSTYNCDPGVCGLVPRGPEPFSPPQLWAECVEEGPDL